MDYALRTDNLSRSFKTVRALDRLTFEVPRGIVFGFLGPNGAGKTTTIRLLLGLLKPTEGRAEVLGFDTSSDAAGIRERCGALLEHTGLYERLSAEANLTFYGRVNRMPRAECSARIRELLERFDLWERRGERVAGWSRGMKQKLAVARSMLHRPSLLFLDEPTAGLDPVAAAGLRDILSRLASDEGLTVFLTTHNLAEAEKLCSRVGIINRGRLVTVGGTDDLRSGGKTVRATITGGNITESAVAKVNACEGVVNARLIDSGLAVDIEPETSLAPVVKLLVAENAAIEEVRKDRASLEDIFLKLMEEERS